MTNEEEKEKNTLNGAHDVFEVWKQYEDIAMHFNELIIQLRVRALGGIAAISALVGFLSKGDTPDEFRWGLLAVVFAILCIVWLAILCLDLFYYNRLLLGAVSAIIDIEELSKTSNTVSKLQLSHRINDAVKGKVKNFKGDGIRSGERWFYGLVFLSLILGFYFSINQYCYNLPDTQSLHNQSICRITIACS